MAVIQDPTSPANLMRVESNGTIRTISQPVGEAYASGGQTTTMAAPKKMSANQPKRRIPSAKTGVVVMRFQI